MFLLYMLLLPIFVQSRQQEISFNEETPIGTIIFDLNTLSPSSITYQLLESSPLLTFNATSNLVSISKRIDRDTLCSNDDTCSKCVITMKFYDMFYYNILVLVFNINDINDNTPTFSSNTYSISLTENNIPGIKIRLSKAEDVDCLTNGVQLYELTYIRDGHVLISSIHLYHLQKPTDVQHEFYLFYDTPTAELYLVINRTLDRESQSEYIFTITANDYSHTVSSKLLLTVLDVNDHLARFSQSIYSVNISHNTAPNTVLLQLTAVDADLEQNARVYYSLLTIDGSNNRNDLFQINSQTGELRLLSNLTQLDSKRIFKLIVAASDGSTNAIPALTTVYINIIPQSRITLTFGSNRVSGNSSEVFIAENLPNATFIAYITSDESLQIMPITSGRGFISQKLSDNSLTLLADRSYDREERASYDVDIRSGDHERAFRIIVTDVNDCKPQWNTSVLHIDVESEPRVFLLNASDADEGVNGQVSYRKHGATWPKWIDLIDNRLLVNCSNDTTDQCWMDLLHGDISINVEAFDHGTPELSSVMHIRLYRRSTEVMFTRYEYMLVVLASLLGLLLVLVLIFLCICCRRRQQGKQMKTTKKKTNNGLGNEHSTKEKIIQSSSSEQSSSAGSLYGSDKSDNITLETAASCHLVSRSMEFRARQTKTSIILLSRTCFSSRLNVQLRWPIRLIRTRSSASRRIPRRIWPINYSIRSRRTSPISPIRNKILCLIVAPMFNCSYFLFLCTKKKGKERYSSWKICALFLFECH